MADVELTLPDRLDSQIDRFVEQGDFLNRERAVAELLSMGLAAYETTDTSPEEQADDLFTQAVEDQQDPAVRDEGDDEPMF